jgi:hypothetical protein
MSLTWNDNSADEEGFAVERKPAGGSFQEIAKAPANAVSYTDKNLAPGEYVYRIRAYKSSAFSSYSNEVIITAIGVAWIKIAKPSQGDALKSGAQYQITWTANRVNNIDIAYSTDNGVSWEMITGLGGVSATDANWGAYVWDVPDITATDVKIRVRDYTDHALFAVSGAFSISPDAKAASIGAAQKQLTHGIQRAGKNAFLVGGIGHSDNSASIYNAHGRLVARYAIAGSEQKTVSLNSFGRGIYVVEVADAGAGELNRLKFVVK